MDYSHQLLKMKQLFCLTLLGSLIMPVIFIIGIFVLSRVKVKNIGIPENYEKINLIIHLIINIILIIAALFFIFKSPNNYKDLLNVINKKYTIDECVVTGQDIAGPADVVETRGVILKSLKTDKEFSFTAYYMPIKEGEYYKVMYWPNSKIGAVIKKISE